MEDILFKMPEIINHNSHEYDLALLEEIKNLRNIPVDKFDSTMRKIMRKKSSCKLWFTYIPSRQWDGKQERDCNYRCIPISRKARSYFCLMLDRTDNSITVTDVFLSAV